MKRKILSLILVFAMTVSLLTVGTGAVEPTYGDTAGHWAESSIERWSAYGIIQGSNGQFDPNGQLTCAQLATILAKLLKLPAAKDAGFTDNTADAWYYDAINRCAAAGILNGNGDGTVTPEAPITRERAMVMLGRALGIEPIREPDLTKYTDAAKVAPYAQGMVAAMIEAGIVGGVTADELAPQDNINRASTVTILDRAISTYADKAGATVKADGKGIVLVVADDVTVTGDVDKLLVPADNVDVTVSGSKNIDDITVTGDNSKVILNNSTANDVTLDGKNTELETKGGSKVENVSVTEDAKGATVNAGSGTTVKNVENSAADTTVTGSGSVKNVASDTDVTVETKGTNVENTGDGKITVTDKNGKDSTVSATGSGSSTTVNKETTSSGGGYSHSHSYVYTDNGDGTHTGRCYANDSTLVPEAHNHDGENGACSICGAKQTTESVASVKAADGTCTYYPTLPGAVAVAADGATITLLNEQELSANLVFSTKVTLNLNGQAVETKGYAIQVQGSGDLTVTGNGTVNNDQEAVEVNNKKNYRTIFSVEGETAKLTIENGTFTTKASQAIFAEGTVTIHDGTFQNTAESVNGALDSSAMITAKGSAANMIIHKASVFATAESGNNGIYGIYGANGAHITLEDGVEVHTSFAAIGMNNTTSNPEVVITVNGGAYRSECQQLDDAKYSKFNAVCYLPGKCQMTINGGTFIAGNNKMHIFSIPYAQAGMNLTIKDGTFTAGSNVFYSKNDNHENQTTANMITVSSGSFTGAIAAFHESNTFSNFVTGGTFSSDPSEYVADGNVAMKNDNSTWTVIAPTAIENGVTIKGIAGYERYAFSTISEAYAEISPKVAALGGLGERTCSADAFNAFYTDDGKITWTIYGKQTLVGKSAKDSQNKDIFVDDNSLTFGRAASYYGECSLTKIEVNAGNKSATLDLSATNGTFALPYNWWGEGIKNCEFSFTGITFDGIKSIPGTWAAPEQKTPYTFDCCTFNGSVYGYHDYNINLTIKNSTFNAPDNTQYAIMLQSRTGISGKVTLYKNTFNNYTRGVNLQRPGTDFIFTNNTITSIFSEPDRAAIQLTDGKSFTVTGNTVCVNAGNAFWFHNAATNEAVTYEISNNNIQAPYIGYYATSFDVNYKITSSDNNFNNTDTNKCMKKDATVAEATNLTAIH